ncbi:hypothetical protein ACEN9H_13775 [Massilia cellulosiltytica]|uniref:hypothetical protein n=1 Tax=Massilia cellulosiltytica TaxID=2683234 RepID=UPI0039B4A55A
MNIVCIAWGSLIWEPGPLKLASDWQPDGPALPLEFVRDSDDSAELALVLHAPAPPMPTRWARLDAAGLDDAREMLRRREKIRPEYPQWVGSLPDPVPPGLPAKTPASIVACIADWVATRDVDAVVWTALPAKFAGVSERAPSPHEAVALLAGLQGDERARAEEYVRRIPGDIRTLYRGVIEERLGWTPHQ